VQEGCSWMHTQCKCFFLCRSYTIELHSLCPWDFVSHRLIQSNSSFRNQKKRKQLQEANRDSVGIVGVEEEEEEEEEEEIVHGSRWSREKVELGCCCCLPIWTKDSWWDASFPWERTPGFVVEIRLRAQMWCAAVVVVVVAAAAGVAIILWPHGVAIAVRAFGLVQPTRMIEVRGLTAHEQAPRLSLEQRQTSL